MPGSPRPAIAPPVLDLIALPEALPFTAALGLMLMLAMLQVVGAADLVSGHLDTHVDAHLDLHTDTQIGSGAEFDGDASAHSGADAGISGGLLSLVGFGQVPFLVWLMVLLTDFGLIGLGAQEALVTFAGQPASAWIAGPLAALLALPVTGALTRPLARLIPRDESSAVSVGALIGREGEIVVGTATPGNPARARVIDRFGQAHHVMLEPDNAEQRFVTGEKVLLVRREGELFKAITRGDHYLPRI